MKIIDLYSGVGGWSLGFRLAGFEVIASYEWWKPAVVTQNNNQGDTGETTDIRLMNMNLLPKGIDVVVGSPPCTEFSYSNKGGKGNLTEGMKDLVCFFEAVRLAKPKYWVMENVPRVASVLKNGFSDPQHPLYRYRELGGEVTVQDISDYGLPQSRKRCVAGNIPFDKLATYKRTQPTTLGDVLNGLRQNPAVDPIWGIKLPRELLTETETEAYFNSEELRMNRDSKMFHPVYNNMSFPDKLHKPARTITATCTRVSRESIVVSDDIHEAKYRRLTIRERATLQSFPITYQFYGASFAEKAKMVGNAIPPYFTFLIAHSILGSHASKLKANKHSPYFKVPEKVAKKTPPDKEGRLYPLKRSFRSAIPNLRFKSGMRFDLSNHVTGTAVSWVVGFFFGTSKEIKQIRLTDKLMKELMRNPVLRDVFKEFIKKQKCLQKLIQNTDPNRLQQNWTKRLGGTSPFEVVDTLGVMADQLHAQLIEDVPSDVISKTVAKVAQSEIGFNFPNARKLDDHSGRILSGMLVGCWFNCLPWHESKSQRLVV